MNSPQSLLQLYGLATSHQHSSGRDNKVWAAELMREVGLKCIGLNGVRIATVPPDDSTDTTAAQVPRTINSLGEFYAGLPADVQAELKKRQPRR